VCATPVQEFRIDSSVTHPSLECSCVEFEEVEQLAFEADGQILILSNLACMTDPNLVDDSSKMGDVS
jgi:hypothetical protein